MKAILLSRKSTDQIITDPPVTVTGDATITEYGKLYEVDSNQSVEITLGTPSVGSFVDIKLEGIGEVVANSEIIRRQGQTLRATKTVSGWVTRKNRMVGSRIRPSSVTALTSNLETNHTTAMTLIKDGGTVFEYGLVSHNADMRSLRKPITALLIGHAVGENQLDLYGTMEDYSITDGADGSEPTLSLAEQQATLEMLLKSRSGVYHPAAFETQEQIDTRPAREAHAPDTFYYYNNWDFNTAQAIYHENVGDFFQAIEDVLGSVLGFQDFDPGLCVETYEAAKSIYPARRVWMSARDRAKIAQLILQRGNFNGVQLIPEWYMDNMWTPYSYISDYNSKGYSWNVARMASQPTHATRPVGFGNHTGAAGQRLYAMPHQGFAAGITCDPSIDPLADVGGAEIIEVLTTAGVTEYGSLASDFTQVGQLKPEKIDSPIQIEDAGGENTLRFNYPVQEHVRLTHTLRIYAGMTLGEVRDSV